MKHILSFSLIALLALSGQARAESDAITQDMVKAKNKAFENVMNEQGDYQSLIRFMHDHISEGATFRVTVTDPTAEQDRKSPVMEMTKADYINSYLQGTRYVDNYEMDIQTIGFEYDDINNEAYSLEVMTERGTMASEQAAMTGNERPFVSRTTCRTRHELRKETLVATASECHTDISFEEDI